MSEKHESTGEQPDYQSGGYVDFDAEDEARAEQFVAWLRRNYRIAAAAFAPTPGQPNLRVRAHGVSLHLLQSLCATFSAERCHERLLGELLQWAEQQGGWEAPCWKRAKRAHRAIKTRLGSE